MYCYFRDRNENVYSVNWPNRFLGSWVHTLPYQVGSPAAHQSCSN